MTRQRNKRQIEFGDFQTPTALAYEICRQLASTGLRPRSVLEPTCGKGNLLLAALDTFQETNKVVGIELNPEHVYSLQHRLSRHLRRQVVDIVACDFFSVNWTKTLNELPESILIIGNPPWVTSAELTVLNSRNLPQKSNFQNYSGLDARTGKSNFDISEWMIIHLLEQLKERQATLAMLCKTSVARKVLAYAWKNQLPIADARLYHIDAGQHFAADVDACLLVCNTDAISPSKRCQVYEGLHQQTSTTSFGFEDGRLVADLTLYARWRHLRGLSPYRWRSGVKHDCANIMEFERKSQQYVNGLGEAWTLESDYLYPLLKSSDLMHPLPAEPRRWMLVPQTKFGDDTQIIQENAPHTWEYLQRHGHRLDGRKSTIYRNQPRFAVFGIGEYTFSSWKVAISGLYKRLKFVAIGPLAGKSVVVDDTCYFIACQSQEEAELLTTILNSDIAQEFFHAFLFWDAKRPITSDILNQLNIPALANELNLLDRLLHFTADCSASVHQPQQLRLLA